MASSIPTYYVYMDMRVPALNEDSGKLFYDHVDTLSLELSKFFGNKTPREYRDMLKKGFREQKAELKLYPKRISYSQLKDLRQLPLYKLGRIKSGLITKELFQRVRPFGSLASRTIGDIYADEAMGGKSGLELFFNKELLGIPGLSTKQKVANHYEETVQVEPTDGMDILSTIDIDLQDIAEKALVDSLKSFEAASGYAILMEVQSGEVKAIVNMQRNADSSYTENRNGSVSDKVEPGSTFKVVSLMAVLDDGRAKITDTIQTGNGLWPIGGRIMRDHNASKGGYHNITLAQAIHASSNIGVSKTIVKAYGDNPSEFVEKLYKMKIHKLMKLEIPGTAKPEIKHPKRNPEKWSATALPWMSIGYETQIPPIYTLAFYNSIANNGKLIRPFFVKAIMKNGQTIKTFETEVINSQICKPATLAVVRETLLGVIEGEKGTAKNMLSKFVRIAGKTGTAQISKGRSGYTLGGKSHQVSFCGYFPADNPLYTLIVVIREPSKGYPSGGKMAGSVFKSIAEQVMSLKSTFNLQSIKNDTTQKISLIPEVKSGNFTAAETVMKNINLSMGTSETEWVQVQNSDKGNKVIPMSVHGNKIPNLCGMGAKDAMYIVNKLGLYAHMSGRGKVISQNLKPGSIISKGQHVVLILDQYEKPKKN
ncbi:MAG TPA: penicillin-binding transpeptidase domain-containing protein, partial [Paludibacter sp.]|nr:penicillin-binding transpeptidase domain-containing protein [Paludibacter sp.]